MLPRESAESEGCSNGTTLANVRYSANTKGLGSCMLECLVSSSKPWSNLPQELLDVVGDQARGQAAGYAAERHVRDAQQPQHFEGPIRALEQVRAASERTRRDRDEVGGEVRRDVRDRRLVYLRDVAGRLETVPVFHTR